MVGLHCCANTDWSAVLSLGLDLLSFDVRLSLDAVLEDAAAVRAFLQSGGRLCLGIVPTGPGASYSVEELVDSTVAGFTSVLGEGRALSEALSRVLVSPACGLRLHSVEDAERIAAEVRAAQALLRARL